MPGRLGRSRVAAGMWAGALLATTLVGGMANAQDADRSITVVLSEEPVSLDGCTASRSGNSRVLTNNVVEGLTKLNAEDGSTQPRLAESWTAVDDLTWEFKLRAGVTFHDGAPLTAETAAKGIDRTLNTDLDCHARQEFFSAFKVTAEAVDELTLRLTTDVPQPVLPTYMSHVMLVSPNTPMDQMVQTAVGTGPYKFGSYNPGEDVRLERNPDWWNGTPEVEAVRFVWRSESSVAAAMVTTGEADLAPYIGSEDAQNPETDFTYPNAETTFVRMDPEFPPLDDRRIRLAMNLAVDRDALRGTIFPEAVEPAANMVLPVIAGYNPELQVYPYDPDQARALIAEAKADGVPVETEIVLIGRTGHYAGVRESAEALVAMWTDVGLNVTLRMMEAGQWGEYYWKPYPADRGATMILTRHNNQSGDAVFTATPHFTCEGSFSVDCDPELDESIKQASQLAGEERVKAWQDIFRTMYEDRISRVMLFHMVAHARVGSRINYKPTLLTNNEIEISTITFK